MSNARDLYKAGNVLLVNRHSQLSANLAKITQIANIDEEIDADKARQYVKSMEATVQYYNGFLCSWNKRTSSDQRFAELEALMTLVNGRVRVGHGKVDPFL